MDKTAIILFKNILFHEGCANFGRSMTLKCLVVDDDPLIGDLIKHFCSKTDQIQFCLVATTASNGLNLLSSSGIDVVFLDYHLPDMKGQEFLERMPDKIPVVMVTSEADFAAKSYEYDLVVDFLVKPLSYDRFQKAIQRVLLSSNEGVKSASLEDSIFVKDGTKWVKIEFDKLLYIKSEGNYSNFLTETGQTMSLITMKDLETKLPNTFIRVHRSYIVNAKKIQMINQDEITIHGKEIPVGEKYKTDLLKWVKEL
ncbi:MAG: response regulator transcription factor [Saprospiraceae bacterium]|nr:response regulator transcription factor [Saprospiraceae bacterium]